MLEGYKKVNHIDLNDTGVTIHPQDWGDGATLTDYAEFSGLKTHLINGRDIKKLFETLGIEPGRFQEVWRGEKRWYDLADLEFNIYEIPPLFASASNTKEIWAKVVGAHLLEIIIVSAVEDETGNDKDVSERITYSGSFTVHWETESESKQESNQCQKT